MYKIDTTSQWCYMIDQEQYIYSTALEKTMSNQDYDTTGDSHFRTMVESVGVKRFASSLSISTRQINRMLSGAQPNPVSRMILCLQSCDPECGDGVIDYLCEEMGGFFVREETVEAASVNAVKECAEAIAAISDGEITRLDEVEIREAVEALIALARAVRDCRDTGKPDPMVG